MPNILDTINSLFKTYTDDEPKPPINILEAGACWTYYGLIMEAVIFEQVGLNTTIDDELKGILNDAIKMCDDQAKKLKEFMQREGVILPPVSEDKPRTESKDIPPGTKLTDSEIANGIAVKVATATIHCATAATKSVRTDIGIMWSKFLAEQITFGMALKAKMRKRGWAKIPPSYTPPGV